MALCSAKAMHGPEVHLLPVAASCEVGPEARHSDARLQPDSQMLTFGCALHKLSAEHEESDDASTASESPTVMGTDSVSSPDSGSPRLCEPEIQVLGWEAPVLPVHTQVATHMAQAAKLVRPWNSSSLGFVGRLQDAPQNNGTVDLMQSLIDGTFVVAKRMPNWWMAADDDDFKKRHSNAVERPWLDIGIIKYLESRNFPYVCRAHGVYRDYHFTYVISSFAEQGDLFKWCDQGPPPGPKREDVLSPVVCQLLHAVQMLHNLGVAHGDLSMENIVVTGGQDCPQIQIIDFSMATCSRQRCNELCGKKPYMAPETLVTDRPYDTFLADAFALGVVLFALGAQEYLWSSTATGECKMFEHIVKKGFQAHLAKRKSGKANGERLNRVFSTEFAKLLEGLLCLEPDGRLTLGEQCWTTGVSRVRTSVWDMPWLHAYA